MKTRRVLLVTLCTLILIAPVGSRAQTAREVPRIALIAINAPVGKITEGGAPVWSALLEEIGRLGYVEGRNLIIDRHSAAGKKDAYTTIAAQVVATKPALVVARGARPLLKALLAATQTIPIVSVFPVDPAMLGIVGSLVRPGGNLTGPVADAGAGLDGKRLQLLHELVPSAARVGYLYRRAQWNDPFAASARDAARKLGITLVPSLSDGLVDEHQYAEIFAGMRADRVAAVLGPALPETLKYRTTIAARALDAKLRGPVKRCVNELRRRPSHRP